MRHLGKYFALRIFGAIPQSVCRQKQPFSPLLKGPKYDTVAIAIKAERQLRRRVVNPGHGVIQFCCNRNQSRKEARRGFGGAAPVRCRTMANRPEIRRMAICMEVVYAVQVHPLVEARSMPISPCGGTAVLLDAADIPLRRHGRIP